MNFLALIEIAGFPQSLSHIYALFILIVLFMMCLRCALLRIKEALTKLSYMCVCL